MLAGSSQRHLFYRTWMKSIDDEVIASLTRSIIDSTYIQLSESMVVSFMSMRAGQEVNVRTSSDIINLEESVSYSHLTLYFSCEM